MMKISELSGSEHEYWSQVANKYAIQYGMTVDDFRVYDKKECIIFNTKKMWKTYVLSNFYPCRLLYNGTWFHSSEQLYFYLCTTTKPEKQRLVMQQPNALAVKKLNISKEDRNANWIQTRNQIMRTCLQVKFEQCPEYRRVLIETGDKDLLEGTYWWDLYWGASTTKKSNYYVGINALGRLHMDIRQRNCS